MTGKIRSLATDKSGKHFITIEVNEKKEAENAYDALANCDKVDISLKKHYNKRSLDCNAYFWTLCGKLSAELSITKEAIYREMVRDIGGNYEVLPIRADAVDKFCRVWNDRGLGWITDTFPSKLHGYVNVMAYYGSSTYDSAQMHRLMDTMIAECKEHGVPVVPQEELDSLLKFWERKNI